MGNIAGLAGGESMSRNLRKFRANTLLRAVSRGLAAADLFVHKSYGDPKRRTTISVQEVTSGLRIKDEIR